MPSGSTLTVSIATSPPDRAAAAAVPRDAVRVGRPRPLRVLVFDSGLGGLTVLEAVARAMPAAALVYAADDAVFPYGRLSEADLVDRVLCVMERLVAEGQPDIVVVACNTASTLVLPPLRARFPAIAIVGTVPAIKPAASLSRSGLISVLATPGTVARQYTRDLVERFAGDCAVTLVGAPRLAALAEAWMRGEAVADGLIAAEIAPAFVETGGRRTDAVVLACTHYPLLLDAMRRLQPWPVAWIDPAPAIARRVAQVAAEQGVFAPAQPSPVPAIFTSGRAPGEVLAAALSHRGLVFRPTEPV